ncbi:MAG: crossover junction endodeoxyribonuclease RuvC [Spirochaetales bacterium]|nr:crossover junction endodeoxyribonuclease RuvC [Spirochaetales bacterium]
MKTVIGIDPGLSATGYGVIRYAGDSVEYVTHGCIKTLPGDAIEQRLLKVYTELAGVIDEYKPEEAGVETIYFAKNIQTAIPVAHCRGTILLLLAVKHVEVFEYTPLEVKKAVVGKGRAEKDQVQNMIKIIFGMKEIPRPDHASDGLAIAFCHSSNALYRKTIAPARKM